MRTIALSLMVSMLCTGVNAQVLGSLFSQKKENRKLLAEQIAALGLYKNYLSKGYQIASQGLGMIHKIKQGDFDLHRDFFGALKSVNPRIRSYGKVAELVALNVQSVGQLKKAGRMIREAGFSPWENTYIRQVVEGSLDLLAGSLDQLIALVSDNQLELKDDERIRRIDELYEQGQQHYGFAVNFCREISLYGWFKEKENNQDRGIRMLHGLEVKP